MSWQKTKHPSVYVRHQNACPARRNTADDGSVSSRCRCTPSYYAQARDAGTKKLVKSKVVHDINEATGWLVDFRRGHAAGTSSGTTFGTLAGQFMEAATAGTIRPKRGDQFADETLAAYRSALKVHVLPRYGNVRADRIEAPDWQHLIDELRRKGFATNTICGVIMPVRSIYRWACSPNRRLLKVNATTGLEMPSPDEQARDRIATPEEAVLLLGALDGIYRFAYALALYAGLRRREMRPARWDWIDLEAGRIHVRESKTKTGIRHVPIAGPLRAIILEERLRQGNPGPDAYLLPSPRGSGAVHGTWILTTAYAAWEDAKLKPIGLHECRHTYASFMIAAMAHAGRFNPKQLSQYMGHSSIKITYDRYGHLMPGNEAEAAIMLDDYLRRSA